MRNNEIFIQWESSEVQFSASSILRCKYLYIWVSMKWWLEQTFKERLQKVQISQNFCCCLVNLKVGKQKLLTVVVVLMKLGERNIKERCFCGFSSLRDELKKQVFSKGFTLCRIHRSLPRLPVYIIIPVCYKVHRLLRYHTCYNSVVFDIAVKPLSWPRKHIDWISVK